MTTGCETTVCECAASIAVLAITAPVDVVKPPPPTTPAPDDPTLPLHVGEEPPAQGAEGLEADHLDSQQVVPEGSDVCFNARDDHGHDSTGPSEGACANEVGTRNDPTQSVADTSLETEETGTLAASPLARAQDTETKTDIEGQDPPARQESIERDEGSSPEPTASTVSEDYDSDTSAEEPQEPDAPQQPGIENSPGSKKAAADPSSTGTGGCELASNPEEFSLDGVEFMETFVPLAQLPDELLVHDRDNITGLCPHVDAGGRKAARYLLCLHGEKPSWSEARSVAHLYLTKDNPLGTGHHGAVYSARLRLALEPGSQEQRTVRVAAKVVTVGTCGAHEMLRREAEIYGIFPKHLSDTTVAKRKEDSEDGLPTATAKEVDRDTQTLPPVVPKYYGYYAALDEGFDGWLIDMHPKCWEDSRCEVSWRTRILLIEECGVPIDVSQFDRAHRSRARELINRFHAEGFVQGSMYTRNILVQPGPLSVPRAERTLSEPSFRLIDFGRAETLKFPDSDSQRRYLKWVHQERKEVVKVLEL
ncbi:hypothetical protein C8Q77DRAFT_1157399 [Trametes polyzona]|nr:hypothetical protein C8Q77DRAFT_1157399 [Trametes polyzona]